jgi:Zn-dependent protease
VTPPPVQQSRSPGAVRLFEVAGISVYLHWTWGVVALILLSTRNNVYQSQIWNVLEYLSIFAIVLMHEFGHAFACRSVGGRAERILLWPLGGVAYVSPPRRPGALLWSIAAGPLVNVALVPPTVILAYFSQSVFPSADADLYQFIDMVATINLILLIFNMLPIYPLDGGQIVHAILWFFMGPWRSLNVAACIGLVGAAGVLVLALINRDFWFVFLAFFGITRSLEGMRQARGLKGMLQRPRHEFARCPICREAPPLGALWRCRCGQVFDTFAQAGRCPRCGESNAVTMCPLCGEMSSTDRWGMIRSEAAVAPYG